MGASSYLQELEKSSTIQSHLADIRCKWKLIPARAPWFGAIWERAIGIIKAGLKKVLGRALVTVEELTTVLLEIEATVNDRPLTYVNSDMEEAEIITPSHLLRGRRLRTFPKEIINEEEISDPTVFGSRSAITNRYRFITKLSTDWWKLWINEYLLALRETHRCLLKEHKHWPSVGDVVLVKDEGPRIYWKLGRITELCPGPDSIVRVVKLKLGKGFTTRPVVNLYPIEQDLDVQPPPQTKGPDQGGVGFNYRPPRQAALCSANLWHSKLAAGDL